MQSHAILPRESPCTVPWNTLTRVAFKDVIIQVFRSSSLGCYLNRHQCLNSTKSGNNYHEVPRPEALFGVPIVVPILVGDVVYNTVISLS